MEDQMAQGGLRGFLFMQHHEVNLKFDKQGLCRRKVEFRTIHHQLFIYDAKDAHRPLHVIDLPRSHGGPTQSNSKMFCLDSMPWDDETTLHLHHNAQHLYFEASSERGRDEWLAGLEERGMRFDKQLPRCALGHRLISKILSAAQMYNCNVCDDLMSAQNALADMRTSFRCAQCDYDVCLHCYRYVAVGDGLALIAVNATVHTACVAPKE